MTEFQKYLIAVASYTTVGRAHFFIGQTKNDVPVEECKKQLLELINSGLINRGQLKPALQGALPQEAQPL